MEWTILVPVKRLREAKSRLRAEGRPGDISALALAFAVDTVTAAAGCGRVVVITSDPVVSARMAALGVGVVADPGEGLNEAVAAGIAVTVGPVAVLTGDLPALRSADLAAALGIAAATPLGIVPDSAGSGTTLLTALDPRALAPRFGVGSSGLHRSQGHVVIEAAESLRADVDTEQDLRVAVALGVGAATAAALS